MVSSFASFLAWAALASASPLRYRAVDSLNEAATAEAHERDNGATRALSDVQIKTSDGKCLFVDKLSGDFRANLTPVQVADCGSTDGQGWDVITAGEHIEGNGVALIVSTLTQACLNFDPRRQAGNQLILFSCGGRADGGGDATNSQFYTFDGGAGPLSLNPQNEGGNFCATVKGNVLDIAQCSNGDASQLFTFGGAAAGGGGNNGGNNGGNGGNGGASGGNGNSGSVTVTPSAAASSAASSAAPAQSTTAAPVPAPSTGAGNGNGNGNGGNGGNGNGNGNGAGAGGIPSVNPTEAVPVSRAGGTLQPTAAAQSHQRDDGATRSFTGVSIRASNGQCLFIDPTAGDFRQNLIPVSLVDCTGAPNEKFDLITAGKHNNSPANEPATLVVSSLTQGCISVDMRRQPEDRVILFSCGGRADGEGQTDGAQLFPSLGNTSFPFAPRNERGQVCVVPGNGRLEAGPCATDGSELFSIFE